MSASGKIFLFILLLPFFAAIGHDVYYSYFLDEDKIKRVERLQIQSDDYMVSDLGWVWNNYSPNTMKQFRESIEPKIWKEKIDPILQYPTMIAALIPFIIGCIFCVFALILGVWPFSRARGFEAGRKDDYAIYKHAKGKSAKYSRK